MKERSWFGYFAGEQLADDKSTNKGGKNGSNATITTTKPVQGLDIANDDDSLTWDTATSGKNLNSLDDNDGVNDDGNGKDDDNDDNEEDVPISSIINSLDDFTKREQEKNITHATFMKLTLTSSAKADLSMYSVPVLSASMALSASMKIDATGDRRIILDLGNMIAVDRITPHPTLPNIISVKRSDEINSGDTLEAFHSTNSEIEWTLLGKMSGQAVENPSFTVKFESVQGKSSVRIASLPLEFVLNKPCIQHIMAIFFYPKPPPPGKPTSVCVCVCV